MTTALAAFGGGVAGGAAASLILAQLLSKFGLDAVKAYMKDRQGE